eukprot:SAG22_NODE_2937_length_2092_cov_1.322629_2_plen_192_part_00
MLVCVCVCVCVLSLPFLAVPLPCPPHREEVPAVGFRKIFHPGLSSGTNSAAANASLAANSSACPPNRCGPCSDDQLFSWSRPFFHSHNQEGSPGGGFGDPAGKAWTAVNATEAEDLADAQIAKHAVGTLQAFKAAKLAKPFFLAVGFHRCVALRRGAVGRPVGVVLLSQPCPPPARASDSRGRCLSIRSVG